MCALSRPVCPHCCTNNGCDRFAISRVTTIDSGTDTSATRASSGEMMSIIVSTPISVSSAFSSWLKVCCIVCWMLSMSLVTRLSSSPRGLRVEVAQRQPVQLVLDVGAQPQRRCAAPRR